MSVSPPLLQLRRDSERGSETPLSGGTLWTSRKTEIQASHLGCLYQYCPKTRLGNGSAIIHPVSPARNLGVTLYPPSAHQQARMDHTPRLVPPGHAQPGSAVPVHSLRRWSSCTILCLLLTLSPNPQQGNCASLYLECPSSSPPAPSQSPDPTSEVATSSERTAGDPSNVASSKYVLSRRYNYFSRHTYLNLHLVFAAWLTDGLICSLCS